jgi:hypothetical protein
VPQVRAKDALSPESDLLGNTLRRDVVGICDEVEPLKLELVEGETYEQTQGTCTRALPACVRRDPVSDRAAVTLIVDSEPDAADDCGSDRHRKTLLVRCDLTSYERKRIRVRIWRRNRRDPPRHLRVVAAGNNGIDVVLGPRTKHEIAVAKLHTSSVETTDELLRPRQRTPLGPVRLCVQETRASGFPELRIRTGRRPTLPGACAPSTIGAGGLNFSVRNGKRCISAAMTAQIVEVVPHSRLSRRTLAGGGDELAHPQNSIATFNVFKIKTSGN